MTGCAGYLGTSLVPRLLEAGFRVRGLDVLTYGDYGMADFRDAPEFEFLEGDIRDESVVREAVRGVWAVLHLAGTSGDASCLYDREACRAINVEGTRILLRCSAEAGVERFLFASTCSVYGARSDWVSEETPPRPLTLYGETKLEAERAVRRSGLPVPVNYRLATLYGRSGRTRLDLVVNLMTLDAVERGVLRVFGGEQWRPLLHVADCAEAFLLGLRVPGARIARQTLNIGREDENLRIRDLAMRVASILQVRVEWLPLERDARSYRVRFEKARRLLGFQPKRNLEQGIQEIADALRKGDFREPRSLRYSTLGRRL